VNEHKKAEEAAEIKLSEENQSEAQNESKD
jgi:hypothetical protein